jgi:hypothetical protein
MPRLSLALSALALLCAAACSGNSMSTPPAGPAGPSAMGHLVDSGIANPRFLRLMHTPPHPPPIKHRITGLERARARAGGWAQLTGVPSFTNGPDTALLMTNGTVMVHDYCTSNWYVLTPSSTGSYANGSWTKAASMPSDYAPLYYASAVLPNGYMIVQGGEYNGISCQGAETNLGAIYDPFSNTWTAVSPPSGWSEIGDGQSVVLSSGTYMLGNCCTNVQALFNENSSSWTQIGTGKQDTNSEEGWTLLPNGDVLVVNVFDPPYAQVYVPSANEWESAGQTLENLITGYEIGPQTLRPDGTVFVAGATGYTAIYNTASGKWSNGPTFPVVNGQQLDVADGPSSLLTNGWVLIPASPGLYSTPTYYYLFNGKKFKSIAAPPNAVNDSTYNTRLVMLPTGQVLETDGSNDVEIYTSPKKEMASLKPKITSSPATVESGQTYTVEGTGLNGTSQDNFYGDDAQMATNFPLVQITVGGTVYYCRTHGFSFMGVQSPSQSVSASFDVPSGVKAGTGTLLVVADGIASKPVAVTVESSPHKKG